MSRFFFDIHDGQERLDGVGSELNGLQGAREHATRLAGQLLIDHGSACLLEEQVRIAVRDGEGLTVFSVTVTGHSRWPPEAGAPDERLPLPMAEHQLH